MELLTYQALISHADNVNRVHAARDQIARIGGDVSIEPPNNLGLVLVTLRLPQGYSPEDILPGIPFYPV
ncbi:MAG TPA: hypothetical protein VFU63_04105 [Ktedonobacterales bacterium]|nr:hypothetical protein [Ktedonobacterales bacterium]